MRKHMRVVRKYGRRFYRAHREGCEMVKFIATGVFGVGYLFFSYVAIVALADFAMMF